MVNVHHPEPLSRPRPPAPAAEGPQTYVSMPCRLLDDLRETPVAVGVYALIGRIYLVTGEPVPLSPGDLQAYDPALSYGAARRALDRLLDSGYILPGAEGGCKGSYRPAWGRVHGQSVPWERGKSCLGRPRHISAVRLDDRLLDLCLGRIRPHPRHRAVVERYVDVPLLGLREVGGYALALGGLPVDSPALTDMHLLDADATPLPLPDDRTVLAVVSQRASLTPAGWRRAGLTPIPPGSGPTAPGQPLFFIPRGVIGSQIGDMIGDPIGLKPEPESPSAAPECRESPPDLKPARSHRSTDSDREDRFSTTAAPGDAAGTGGGGAKQISALAPAPSTASAAGAADSSPSRNMLRSIGVRADVATQLADRPAEQVARVIAQARQRPGVRDLAAWVVSSLRAQPKDDADNPDEAPDRPVSAHPIYFHPGLDADQRSNWLMRFRRAQTPYEQRAILARLEREHPVERVKDEG